MSLPYILVFLACCHAISGQVCDVANQDCTCRDVSFEFCQIPVPAQELHVDTLEECIQNCDLFGQFGQCNYLLFLGKSTDENCKLIAQTEITEYLNTCRLVGQPLRDAKGNCMASFIAEDGCSKVNCDECHLCDSKNDVHCANYAETECLKLGVPGETVTSTPNFDMCLAICTNLQDSNGFTYVTYEREKQECVCYTDGLRDCKNIVMPYGMTLEDAQFCSGCQTDADCPVARPHCSPLDGLCFECLDNSHCSGATPVCNLDNHECEAAGCECPAGQVCDANNACVECLDDTHCQNPDNPYCNVDDNTCVECLDDSHCTEPDETCELMGHICSPVCNKDDDCEANEFCDCPTTLRHECHEEGRCGIGCRVGQECLMPTSGLPGICNGQHMCGQDGGLTLTAIVVGTKDCSDCSETDEGAVIKINMHPEGTCTTDALDDDATADYKPGSSIRFTQEPLLSQCFYFDVSYNIDLEISWNGAGTWTPQLVELERSRGAKVPLCCSNTAGLSVSKGDQPISIQCETSQTYNC